MVFERRNPDKQTIRAVTNFIESCESETLRIHSLMLVSDDSVVYERWWEPHAPQIKHELYSLSKSFTSMGIGIAIDEGLLSLDALITDIFTSELTHLGERVPDRTRRMTIRNLLTMNTGHTYENWTDPWSPEIPVIAAPAADNNIEGFLTAEVEHEPGAWFFYNTLATYMLSAAITRITGDTLENWLKPRLFDPLGIVPDWTLDPKTGVSLGGIGLKLCTEDIAALGLLTLNNGAVGGTRIVSAEYVQAATSKQTESRFSDSPDWHCGYGYQFWQCTPQGVYRGDGRGGQFLVVKPLTRTIVAITAGENNMGRIMELIWRMLAEME